MGEDKKKKQITVKEIKEIAPLADVYELNPYAKYFVKLPASSLVGGNAGLKEKANQIAKMMQAMDIPCVILVGASAEMSFLEIGEKKV